MVHRVWGVGLPVTVQVFCGGNVHQTVIIFFGIRLKCLFGGNAPFLAGQNQRLGGMPGIQRLAKKVLLPGVYTAVDDALLLGQRQRKVGALIRSRSLILLHLQIIKHLQNTLGQFPGAAGCNNLLCFGSAQITALAGCIGGIAVRRGVHRRSRGFRNVFRWRRLFFFAAGKKVSRQEETQKKAKGLFQGISSFQKYLAFSLP